MYEPSCTITGTTSLGVSLYATGLPNSFFFDGLVIFQ
jgi:hypothetical protein